MIISSDKLLLPALLYFSFFSDDISNLLIERFSHYIRLVSYINVYFCNVFTPRLHHEVKGGGDRHISNGVFLRFGFDCSKSWENFQTMSRTKQ